SLLDELRASGALRLLTPREYGGLETPLTTALDVYERLARIDASVAWVTWNANWGFVAALLDESGAAEIFEGDPILANAGGRPAPATEVDGGYRITGEWKLVSGVSNADWVLAVGAVSAWDVRLFALHRDQVRIDRNWDPTGLRGSGSHSIHV